MMWPAVRVQIGCRFHLFWRLLLLVAVVLAPLTSCQSSVAPVQNSAPTTTATPAAASDTVTHSERTQQGGSDKSPPRDKSVVTAGGAAAAGDGEDTTLPVNLGDAVIRLVKAPDLGGGGGGEPKTNSRDETIVDRYTRLAQQQQHQGAVEVEVQAEMEVEEANAERDEQLMAIDRAMAAAAAALSAAAESAGSTSSTAAAASQALQLWRQAAELGSVDAAYNVAWHQLLGRLGVPVAVAEARQQLQQLAAEHGHADAQMAVGFLYATGLWANGSAADQRRALLYYTFAALGGSTPARMALGYRHLAGVHTPASCETALLYYQMASAHVIEQSTRHGGDSASSSSAETPPPSAAAAASEVFNAGEEGGGVGGYGGGVRSLRVSRVRLYDETEGGGSGGGGSRGWTVSLNEDQIQYYQFLADKGDEQAQLALGQLLYQGGRGVRRDVHAALHYIRSAATAGSADAQALLGKMYMEGSAAVTADAERAMHHYRLASEKGSVAGHYGVGVLLARAGDHRQAIVHLERAAELGWPEAMVQLGTMYQRGDGVQPDLHKAFKYFFNAAQYGNLLAIYSIAQMYANGSGAGRSCQIAVDLYKSVAERGSWAELFMEAHDDWLRAGGGATSDAATTATLKYLFLAELGYETAQSNAAYLLELAAAASSSSSSSPPVLNPDLLPGHQLYKRALALWSRAAAQGYDVARVKVGDYHYYGRGTPVDLETAVDHYRIASDQLHSARAMFNLGYMHEHGLGLPADLHLAKRLYDQAAETSADAVVPVALVSIKLAGKFLLLRLSKLDWSNISPIVKLQQWSESGLTLLEYFLFTYVDIGNNWDLYLMSLLAVFLLTSLLLRRMR